MVVIGIIGVLTAIILPALGAARETSRRIKCLSNLRQIGLVAHIYADDNKGRLPLDNAPVHNILWDGGIGIYEHYGKLIRDPANNLAGGYIDKPAKVFWCPSAKRYVFDDPSTGAQYLGVLGNSTKSN